MKAVLQRVSRAEIRVQGTEQAAVGRGLLVLLGIEQGDSPEDAALIARKIATMRLFPDAEGRLNRSVSEVQGEILLVSQFTLGADCRQGRRPSFSRAAPAEVARPLFEAAARQMRELHPAVMVGPFGAAMQVSLVNEGPVTIILDSRELRAPG